MMMKSLTLCLMICSSMVHGFLPNQNLPWLSSTSGSTTHHEMTEAAHRVMAVCFMTNYPAKYPDQVMAMSSDSFKVAAKDFKIGVEAPDLNELHDVDKIHVNGETILEANNRLLTERVNVINAILAENMVYARELTGQLFNTLQDFYSHTNWVEMEGGIIHPAWGVPGQAANVAPVAGEGLATCTDCTDPSYQTCISNAIVHPDHDLTSGYILSDPLEDPALVKPEGKCSHGGKYDMTVNITGTGGINKDVNDPMLSPHHNLHNQAAAAAEAHTLAWFKSLRSVVTDDQFEQYIGLTSASTLCFVVDTTGSMSAEISAVKAVTIALTSGADSDKISDFVLSQFSDPGVGPALRTTDASEMITALNTLFASGGGDFPELLFGGLLLALELVKPGSHCYLFTDAPAKDEHLFGAGLALALAKKVKVSIFLTYNSLSPAQFAPLSKTSLSSGGQVMVVSNSNIDEAVDIVGTSLGTTEVTVLQLDGVTGSTVYEFPVDETLSDVVVAVSSGWTIFSVVFMASGVEQFPTQTVSASTIKVYTIPNPVVGTWTVQVTISGNRPYGLKVTGSSLVDFSHCFVEEVETAHPGYLTVVGKPSPDDEGEAIIVVEPIGSFSPVTGTPLVPGLVNVTDLVLITELGTELQRHSLVSLVDLIKYEARVTLPTTGFRLMMEGADSSGNKLQRLEPSMVVTTQSILHLNIEAGAEGGMTITPGGSLVASLSITNLGPDATYNLAILDTLGFFMSILPASVSLSNGETQTVLATFDAPAEATFGQVTTVTATAVRTDGGDLSCLVFYIAVESLVEDTTPPQCNIMSSIGDCSLTKNGGNCSAEQWSITFSAQDTGIGMHSVKATEVHPGVSLVIDAATTDSVNGTYTSDCCFPGVTLSASDLLGNSDTCSIEHDTRRVEGVCDVYGNGTVKTFDGAVGLQVPAGVKSTISLTVNKTDECKFIVRVATDSSGFIDWAAIAVGVHSKNYNKMKRNFAFNRYGSGAVEERGQGFKGARTITSLPYTWPIDTELPYPEHVQVTITGDSTGWLLTSAEPCTYKFYFGIDGPEPILQVTVGDVLMDKLTGICNDFDGDHANDV